MKSFSKKIVFFVIVGACSTNPLGAAGGLPPLDVAGLLDLAPPSYANMSHASPRDGMTFEDQATMERQQQVHDRLIQAVKNANYDQILEACAAGADVNMLALPVSKYAGLSVLHILACYGFAREAPALVSFLLDEGADIDLRSADGETPLYLAAANGNLPVAQRLCERGAGLLLGKGQDGEEVTPLEIAQRRGHQPVAVYLTNRILAAPLGDGDDE